MKCFDDPTVNIFKHNEQHMEKKSCTQEVSNDFDDDVIAYMCNMFLADESQYIAVLFEQFTYETLTYTFSTF